MRHIRILSVVGLFAVQGNLLPTDFYEERVAFARRTEGVWQIWTMRPNGSELKQLTQGNIDKRQPAWSADGAYLIYADSSGTLFKIGKDGGEPVTLLRERQPIAEPALSSEGRIAFSHVRPAPGYTVEVWTDDLEGKSPKLLTHAPARQLHPSWSPDGRRVVVSEFDPEKSLFNLVAMNPDGSVPTLLFSSKVRLSTPSWSHDGKQIVFSMDQDGNHDLWSLEIRDPKPVRLTSEADLDVSPVYSPDDASILFVSRRSGALQIWRMPSSGGKAEPVTHGEDPSRDPAWGRANGSARVLFSDVRIKESSGSPKETTIQFRTSAAGRISLEVLDSTFTRVAWIEGEKTTEAGMHSLTWNGTQTTGVAATPGVYFLRLKGRDDQGFSYWDPTRETGGEYVPALNIRANRENRSIHWESPCLGVARVRVGIQDGPMFATPLEWTPLPAGASSVQFSGELSPAWGNFWDRMDGSAFVTIYSLPVNAVLYRSDPSALAPRPASPHVSNSRELFVHAKHLPKLCRDFGVAISLTGVQSNEADGLPVVGDQAMLEIDAANSADREVLENGRFEVMVYIDGFFYLEDEDSALPFHVPLDLSRFPDGVHSLLVNFINYQDHRGSAFYSFRIQRRKGQ